MKLDFPSIIVGAVISLVIGIALARWFKSKRRMTALTDQVTAIDPAREKIPTQVTVNYGGKTISNLQRFRFGIWNSGNTPILSEHLISGSAIITIPAHEILDVFGLEQSRPEVGAQVEPIEGGSCRVSFKLLDETDYINLTVYAEKLTESTEKPKVECGVIGMPKGVMTRLKSGVVTLSDAPFFGMFAVILGYFVYLMVSVILTSINTERSPILGWFFNPGPIPFYLVLIEILIWAVVAGAIALLVGAIVFGLIAEMLNPIPKPVRTHFGIVRQDKIKRIIDSSVTGSTASAAQE